MKRPDGFVEQPCAHRRDSKCGCEPAKGSMKVASRNHKLLLYLALRGKLGDRCAVTDDWYRTTGKVPDHGALNVNAQILVKRGQKVFGANSATNRVFATLVGRSNHLTGADTTSGKQHRIGPRPVIAAGLNGAGRHTRYATATAGHIRDARGTPNSPVTTSNTRRSSPRA